MLENEKKLLVQRLKVSIREAGILQKDLAVVCKVSDQAVSGWLKTGKLDKSHLAKIATLTGVSVGWLLTGDGEQRAQPQGCGLMGVEEKPPAYTESYRVLDRLRALVESRQLVDEDMRLLWQIAQRMQRDRKI